MHKDFVLELYIHLYAKDTLHFSIFLTYLLILIHRTFFSKFFDLYKRTQSWKKSREIDISQSLYIHVYANKFCTFLGFDMVSYIFGTP